MRDSLSPWGYFFAEQRRKFYREREMSATLDEVVLEPGAVYMIFSRDKQIVGALGQTQPQTRIEDSGMVYEFVPGKSTVEPGIVRIFPVNSEWNYLSRVSKPPENPKMFPIASKTPSKLWLSEIKDWMLIPTGDDEAFQTVGMQLTRDMVDKFPPPNQPDPDPGKVIDPLTGMPISQTGKFTEDIIRDALNSSVKIQDKKARQRVQDYYEALLAEVTAQEDEKRKRQQELARDSRLKRIVRSERAKVVLYVCTRCEGLTIKWFGQNKLCAFCSSNKSKGKCDQIVVIVAADGSEREMKLSQQGVTIVSSQTTHPVLSKGRKIRK